MSRCEEGARAGYRDCLRYQKVTNWITFTSTCLFFISTYCQDWFSAVMMFLLVCYCVYMQDHWRKQVVEWLATIENARAIDKECDEVLEHMNELIRAAEKKVQDDKTR